MEGKDKIKEADDSASKEMDLDERKPAEGAEEAKEGNLAAALPQPWRPNQHFVKALLEMGISKNSAEKGLFYTGNISAEAAADWVFENMDKPGFHDAFQIEHALSGFSALKENVKSPYKMVFVVNDSLKMGVGKIAAQVGHAAIGLFRELVETKGQFAHLVEQWQENGETKIVLKGDNTQALMDLENLAIEHRLPSYLVTDAGRTQVTPGAVTVLGLVGDSNVIDAVTGNLKLL